MVESLSLNAALAAASTAIDASAAGAAVASQNIANATTPGYAREELDLTTLPNEGGVASTTVERLVSTVTRNQLVVALGQQSLATNQSAFLSQIQSLLGEPSAGLGTLLSQFWTAWQMVGANPSDLGARSALVGAAQQVVTQFHTLSSGLAGMSEVLTSAIQQQLTQANGLTQQVASLNAQIESGQASGANVDTLLDQRDQLVQQLANLVGAAPAQPITQDFTLVVGGQPLVVGTTAYALSFTTAGGTPAITWQATGTPAPVTSGEIGAELGAVAQTIPQTSAQFDALASALAGAVNALHVKGYTLQSPPTTGEDFFQGTTAGTLQVNPAIAGNPQLVAASATGAAGDGGIAQDIANLATTPLGTGQTIAQTYDALVTQVGADVAAAQGQETTAQAQVSAFQQLDQSVSGVSLSDEQTALVLDQQQAQAASSALRAIQAMLQSLLNAVGG
jgi:flagellar hook-associated protein 1 FlgK